MIKGFTESQVIFRKINLCQWATWMPHNRQVGSYCGNLREVLTRGVATAMKRNNPESDWERSINRTWQLGGQCPKRTMCSEKSTGGFKLGPVSTERKRE